ncbi:FUCTA-like protein [Mya arenaria]|uniref:Fucosyltransferase n=1 Tax=Mya arenaria TaxID=6604 RepID=A0ABY7E065_MYAAR|nr:FUCTA-like protein [Mya arenaria]
MKFRKACTQLNLLNKRLSDMHRRLQAARKSGDRRSIYNLQLQASVTEGVRAMFYEHDVIPIVMGAAPEDYRRAAPHYSFIHVDEYPSARTLADYLHQLDANDNAYNEYFRWKGTGEFVNTYFWCRLCAMFHDDTRQMTTYDDVNKWWRGKDVCIGKDRLGEHADRGRYISDFYT